MDPGRAEAAYHTLTNHYMPPSAQARNIGCTDLLETAAANDVENKRKLFLEEDFSSSSAHIPVMTED